MTSTNWLEQFYKNKQNKNKEYVSAINDDEFAILSQKLHTDVERANSVFVHFDHIQGESEIDRYQIFSNLLKAAVYLGLNVEKIDFHRKDA